MGGTCKCNSWSPPAPCGFSRVFRQIISANSVPILVAVDRGHFVVDDRPNVACRHTVTTAVVVIGALRDAPVGRAAGVVGVVHITTFVNSQQCERSFKTVHLGHSKMRKPARRRAVGCSFRIGLFRPEVQPFQGCDSATGQDNHANVGASGMSKSWALNQVSICASAFGFIAPPWRFGSRYLATVGRRCA